MRDTVNETDRPVLEVSGLTKHFGVHRGLTRRLVAKVHAVDGVSFSVGRGETLGIVGESGCGKSTLGKTVLRLLEPTDGSIRLNGTDISHMSDRGVRPYRRQMQIVFQDPYSSLNPRLSAGEIVGEPLTIHGVAKGREKKERVADLFQRVGLPAESVDKHPHEFSGGQRQRIGIARALSLNPDVIVCDEPVSALDVSIQAQVVNLLIDLQEEFGLSYLFIAHDLAVVRHISHRVAVMYLGRIVEITSKDNLFAEPLHPYSQALLSAIPKPDPKIKRSDKIILKGDVPSPIAPPAGCHFHTRCPHAMERCRVEPPVLREVRPGHMASCHLLDDV